MKMRKNRWRLLAAFLSFFIVVSLPKPVKAITTGSRLLNDHPVEPSGDFISINVDGIIENQSNHQISIPFIDFSLNQAKTISQKALLETISNRLHESELNHNLEVI
ncbi:hypothetical protein ACVRZD_09415 [Streptococcus hongkongensis]|nr:hypothetical protein NC01_07190 [Streptococcus uberis]